jgi:glycosyltransferase involved in cell wall biosynthesis
LRIVFASEFFPPYAPGGAEWTNLYWARDLAGRGHEVIVFTINYGAAPEEAFSEGVRVVRFPFPARLQPGQGEPGNFWLRNPFFHFYFGLQIWRRARRLRPDVLHAQGKGALPAVFLAARLLGTPAFFTVRDISLLCPLGMCPFVSPETPYACERPEIRARCFGFYCGHYLKSGPLSRFLLRLKLVLLRLDVSLKQFALRRLDAVVAVSRGILEVFRPELLPEKRMIVRPLPPSRPAADPARARQWRRKLNLDGRRTVVFYAGKLSMGKGVHVLKEAAATLSARRADLLFVFAGKEGNVKVEESDSVRPLGSRDQDDMAVLYEIADMVVQPSVWPEPLSRVIVEAMAAGKPVIGTRVGGTAELIEHGKNGLLILPGDAASLAEVIEWLAESPEQRRSLGQAAMVTAKQLLSDQTAAQSLESLYQRGAADRRNGAA